jgi:uncharacterized protein
MSDKPGRNDPCPCGSGKKYKACCFQKNIPGKKKFSATQLVNKGPKPIDLMERTFGDAIARTHQIEKPPVSDAPQTP